MLAVLPAFVGTEFEIVALAPPVGPLTSALEELGVPTIAFDVRDGRGERREVERILHDLHAAIGRVRPDLIHGNSLSIARLTGALAGEAITRGSQLTCTAHLRDIVRLSARAVGQLNANRALVAVSNAVRDFHASQGVDSRRMHVVYNGVGRRETGPPRRDGRLRGELGLAPDAFLIATVGQICLRKGQDVLAKAAPLAAPRMPTAHFVLVGERYSSKPESIDYAQSVADEFHAAGLSDRFHPLGYRTDVERLLTEVDLLVHCARQEPFGRVLLEAGVAGCPAIATAVGGTEEILVDEQSALLVPANDHQALAAAMARMYGDPALRDRLGRAVQERVTRLFPIEQSARGLADIWRRALSE